MDNHILEDEDLMARVAGGSRDALEPLLRRHATPLLTFVERMVGHRQLAEEMFQDVFLLVWKNRRSYEHPRPFRAWLYAIAVKTAAARSCGVRHCRSSPWRKKPPRRPWNRPRRLNWPLPQRPPG